MVANKKYVDGYSIHDEIEAGILEDHRIEDIYISEASRRRYAKILLDVPFKMVFGQPASAKTMIQLLECLIPDKKIKEISYLDKESPGFLLDEKRTVFDLYCRDDQGQRFIIEMQLRGQDYFTDRALYYATYPIREQLNTRAEEQRHFDPETMTMRVNYQLMPVYVICILNFKLNHQPGAVLEDGILARYSLRSDFDGELMTDALHFIFLELPRLQYKKEEASLCKTMLEKLAFCFRYIDVLKERPAAFSEDLFRRIFHAAEIANMTIEEFHGYQSDLMENIDLSAQDRYAIKKGLEKGMRKGMEKGMAKGMKKGMEKGMAKGMEKMIISMRNKGMEIKEIARISELCEEKIEKILTKRRD